MAAIEFVWDSSEITQFRRDHMGKALKSALSKAGGDAIRAMRASGKKLVRDRSRIRAGYLADKAFPLTFPRGARQIEQLAWRLDVSGQVVPLGEFPRRQTKKGASVEVLRGQRKVIASAFLATRKTGKVSVFLRPTKQRYPMGHMVGPSVANLFNGGNVVPQVIERGQTVFGSAFTRLFALELGKK